ncbi:adenosylcobinamide-phosphate synthase CbiB [Bacteroides caecimuris]|uniref:adenosylcobinamide-phosphate synthase CbiB n=2 Tax=Bacteroidales TaxID=171549 RepID=UPI0026493A0A|nr:adenosylcobinamide-phosphate synthase CbiB [Bacteroides caecimuris]
MDFIISIIPLLVAWLLDILLGDPQWLSHPVIWFGKAISLCEHQFNKRNWRRLKGGLTAILLIVATYLITWRLLRVVSPFLWLDFVVRTILIFYCLAGTTLIREVRMVFSAVDRSLEEGRRQVGRIVGRDTANLSAQEIRTAGLETLAENLSDGVIAPLFWFALLGIPGMMAYKMVNTLDSMIGYKSERYRQFGMVAARIDDLANYIPARLTACLMVIASGKMSLFGFVRQYGSKHASPNSGYPEAALAGILDCRFGGTHDYFGESVYKPYIGESERDFSYADIDKAGTINRKVEVLSILLVVAVKAIFLL